LTLTVNGKLRSLTELEGPVGLLALVEALGVHPGRVAVELNGEIRPRSRWDGVTVVEGDRLEIVHFVGGGSR